MSDLQVVLLKTYLHNYSIRKMISSLVANSDKLLTRGRSEHGTLSIRRLLSLSYLEHCWPNYPLHESEKRET